MKEFSLETVVITNNAGRYGRNVINKQRVGTVSFLAQHLHNFQ
jgi:hypothetical protein